MDNIWSGIMGAFQITLLDIVLSGDNIGVIALATKNLPEKYAKKASAIGVFGAVALRIVFACFVTYILMIESLPIKLVGGLLLIKITWDFIKPSSEKEDHHVNTSSKFMGAVYSIIIADATMSLDNVLAIAGAAHGNIVLIIFGLLINIPIIFWGSQYVAKLMNKHPIVIYIGGAILAHTSVKMILEDNLLSGVVPEIIQSTFPYLAGILTLIYGFAIINKPLKSVLRKKESKL